MKLGNYEFEIEDLEINNKGVHELIINDVIVLEIYDGVDADEDGACSDIWVKVDGKHIDWTWELIKEFREEISYYYGN